MKIAKIILFLMAVAILPSSMLAQKCKFDKEEKDKFTGQKVRSSRFKVGGAMYSWWILMEQKGDKNYMTYQIAVNGKVDESIRKGSKILMKLEDNSIVELEIDNEYNPTQSVEGTASGSPFIVSMWLPRGELSKDQMKSLSASNIAAIRINIANKDLDSPDIS